MICQAPSGTRITRKALACKEGIMANHASYVGECMHCKQKGLTPDDVIHLSDCPIWVDFVKNDKGEIAEFFRARKANES